MPEAQARLVRVRGVVQGVGFRPFVFRLARENALAGWVLNEEEGVEIHVEGSEPCLDAFVRDLTKFPPPAARIRSLDVAPVRPAGARKFEIRASELRARPAAAISPDLPVCERCLRELFDASAPRYGYPYINCTDCGPRYSILRALPYDRPHTTMAEWSMDAYCVAQYLDPDDRRFHAQPVACPHCGPHYYLETADALIADDGVSITETARLLRAGAIVAIKGLGGYHLCCDARNAAAVASLRERKYRKEKPFALLAADLDSARALADFSAPAEELLLSSARPIVLAPARVTLENVAPDTNELGIMLPGTPLHYLLFAAGAPDALVMTSANRSSEPIAYRDEEARESLDGIADAFLIGERPIARRIDDSVARAGAFGPIILRRSRGYAPAAVASLPRRQPILALGADLKNSIALAIDGEILVSQHIGDLDHHAAVSAFQETIDDLLRMYDVSSEDLLLAYDAHPQYRSTLYGLELPAAGRITIQHHRAHIASAVAECGEYRRRVLGVAFDGTGYGDDGAIWGGEIFSGSVAQGFQRIAHLREAELAGGDAAARHPVQAAAGFLAQLDALPDLDAEPFFFPPRYDESVRLLRSGLRTFRTTSIGRLFDAVAALTGFTRPITFEGQAAMWLENLARQAGSSEVDPYPFPLAGCELDFRPMLEAICRDRFRGREPAAIARAFHRGLAVGAAHTMKRLCRALAVDAVVLSGGVFQNELLLEDLRDLLPGNLQIITNHAVPPNDGGICLGQAALAAFATSGPNYA